MIRKPHGTSTLDWLHELVEDVFVRHDHRRLFFWSTSKRPADFVRDLKAIDLARRDLLVAILASGKHAEAYMGWAECRICGARLGTSDLTAFGYTWPEKAEHYVVRHHVWLADCDALLAAAEAARAKGRSR